MRDVELIESEGFTEARVDGHQVYVETLPSVPEYWWDAPYLHASGDAETYEEAVAALTAKLADHGVRLVRLSRGQSRRAPMPDSVIGWTACAVFCAVFLWVAVMVLRLLPRCLVANEPPSRHRAAPPHDAFNHLKAIGGGHVKPFEWHMRDTERLIAVMLAKRSDVDCADYGAEAARRGVML